MLLLLACAPARAELTCEQLGVIAEATVVLRNQGTSLAAVLADAERGDMKNRFSARELEIIRQAIREVFIGSLAPHELVEACRAGNPVQPRS